MTIRVNGIPGQLPVLAGRNYSKPIATAIDALSVEIDGIGHLFRQTQIVHLNPASVKVVRLSDIPAEKPLTILTCLGPCLMFGAIKFDNNNIFQKAIVGHFSANDVASYILSSTYGTVIGQPESNKHIFLAGWGDRSSAITLTHACNDLLRQLAERQIPANFGWADENSPFFFNTRNDLWFSSIGGIKGKSKIDSRATGFVIDKTGFVGFSFEYDNSMSPQLLCTNIFLPDFGIISIRQEDKI